MRSFSTFFIILSTLLYLGSGCQVADEQQLIITGSSTVAPLLNEMAKHFEATHPGTRIDVQSGGSSRGINDVRQRVADIGMVSRALKPSESDLQPFRIACDGIGIILHLENQIRELSPQNIIDIYTKKITNWQDFGGANAKIIVIHKADGRSTQELFVEYFQLKNTEVVPDIIIGENEQAIKLVAGNTASIAYVSIGTAEYDQTLGIPIKLLPIHAVAATRVNVANGSFPIVRDLTLVTLGQPNGLAQEFIAYTQSAQVTELIEKQYFVAPTP